MQLNGKISRDRDTWIIMNIPGYSALPMKLLTVRKPVWFYVAHQRRLIGPGKLLMFGVRKIAQNRPQIVKFLGLK
jgi:hypothetical protein